MYTDKELIEKVVSSYNSCHDGKTISAENVKVIQPDKIEFRVYQVVERVKEVPSWANKEECKNYITGSFWCDMHYQGLSSPTVMGGVIPDKGTHYHCIYPSTIRELKFKGFFDENTIYVGQIDYDLSHIK